MRECEPVPDLNPAAHRAVLLAKSWKRRGSGCPSRDGAVITEIDPPLQSFATDRFQEAEVRPFEVVKRITRIALPARRATALRIQIQYPTP